MTAINFADEKFILDRSVELNETQKEILSKVKTIGELLEYKNEFDIRRLERLCIFPELPGKTVKTASFRFFLMLSHLGVITNDDKDSHKISLNWKFFIRISLKKFDEINYEDFYSFLINLSGTKADIIYIVNYTNEYALSAFTKFFELSKRDDLKRLLAIYCFFKNFIRVVIKSSVNKGNDVFTDDLLKGGIVYSTKNENPVTIVTKRSNFAKSVMEVIINKKTNNYNQAIKEISLMKELSFKFNNYKEFFFEEDVLNALTLEGFFDL